MIGPTSMVRVLVATTPVDLCAASILNHLAAPSGVIVLDTQGIGLGRWLLLLTRVPAELCPQLEPEDNPQHCIADVLR